MPKETPKQPYTNKNLAVVFLLIGGFMIGFSARGCISCSANNKTIFAPCKGEFVEKENK